MSVKQRTLIMSTEFDALYGDLNSLSIDGNVTEETKGLFSHPSPSSVLEFSTPTLLGNGIGNTIIEEGSVFPIFEEEQSVLDFWEVPIMSPYSCFSSLTIKISMLSISMTLMFILCLRMNVVRNTLFLLSILNLLLRISLGLMMS
ncbi:hypothetical protein SO802_021135 [Lithocarpus litseifolius]|uniref:Uncharacterized protein n=1 Tax=Lithocarpus litseifolius TaxID=425828 RepID=A0AAW2CGU9_9ROSI